MFFNLKTSKVYKNAQALLKAAKKQFVVEKELLLEAILVVHPDGAETALIDEAEQMKTLKMAPPPKKAPTKPHKPSRVDKKPSMVSKPSMGEHKASLLVILSDAWPYHVEMYAYLALLNNTSHCRSQCNNSGRRDSGLCRTSDPIKSHRKMILTMLLWPHQSSEVSSNKVTPGR